MIRFMKICVALGLVWSLYWYGAGYIVRREISSWFQDRQVQGWQADYAEVSTSGFPLRHVTTLTSPALADPATGTAWQADWLHLDSPAIWPGKQTVSFPGTVQRLSYFDQTVEVVANEMTADLHLKPGTALELDRMALSSGPWQIAAQGADILGGQSLTLAMQNVAEPATYRFSVVAPQFAPDESLRRLAGVGTALPDSFQTLEMDMTVQFDRSWDRRALEERRPQPVAIDLRLAQAEWGALSVFAAGKVTVDRGGVPTGNVTFKAENWRDMLYLAQKSGAIPDFALRPTERILELLAKISGNPDVLDVELTLANGSVSLGPFPLGPAPAIRLR